MPIVGIRELSRETAGVIELLQNSGEPVVITKQGKPIATLAPVDEAEAQNLVLSLAPEIHEISSSADVDVSPRKTRSIDEVSEELAAEALQTPDGRAALAEFNENIAQQRTQVSSDVAQVFADAQSRAQRVMDEAMRSAQDSVRVLQERVTESGELKTAKETGKRLISGSKGRVQKTSGKGAVAKSR